MAKKKPNKQTNKQKQKQKQKGSKCSNPTFPGMQNVDIILSLYERIRKFPNV